MVFVVDLIWGKSYYNMSNFVLLLGFNLFEKKLNNLDKLIKNS